MYDLYKTIELLCQRNGISINKMCKLSGAAQGSLADLKAGRSKNLSSKNVAKIASFFGVSTDFILGFEDSNGLTSDAWKQLATPVWGQEEVFGVSLDSISVKSGVPRSTIDSFISGMPISIEDMDAIARSCGEEPGDFYGPLYKKLQKNKPADDGRRFEVGTLEYAAHKYAGMISDEDRDTIIKLMKTFAEANRTGGENGEAG